MTFIIAEAGVNHEGNFSSARKLVNAAKEAGANAVKFQAFNSRRLWGDDRISHLELNDGEMATIARHCHAIGIEFMVTPFGVPEVEFLAPMLKRWKVASGCLEKWDLLAAIRATHKPVILSTGMADIPRITKALHACGYASPATDRQPFTLLHCVSAYPCRVEDANLAAMDTLRWQWGAHHLHEGAPGQLCEIGYSDHTQGITIALAAVAMGATVLEKHMTLDRNASGPDHKASIEPKEFRIMVDAIRMIESARGDGVKRALACEEETRRAWYGDQR